MTTKIFVDLEFSDLKSTAVLISAAFVSDRNESLYIEVEESFWRPHASQFVLEVVQPLLSGSGLPASQVAGKIVGWIKGRGSDVTLISDSDWDQKMLIKHLRYAGYCRPNWHWEKVPMDLPPKLRPNFNAAYVEWFLRSGRAQHHALNDAQALRDTYLSVMSAPE